MSPEPQWITLWEKDETGQWDPYVVDLDDCPDHWIGISRTLAAQIATLEPIDQAEFLKTAWWLWDLLDKLYLLIKLIAVELLLGAGALGLGLVLPTCDLAPRSLAAGLYGGLGGLLLLAVLRQMIVWWYIDDLPEEPC